MSDYGVQKSMKPLHSISVSLSEGSGWDPVLRCKADVTAWAVAEVCNPGVDSSLYQPVPDSSS